MNSLTGITADVRNAVAYSLAQLEELEMRAAMIACDQPDDEDLEYMAALEEGVCPHCLGNGTQTGVDSFAPCRECQ